MWPSCRIHVQLHPCLLNIGKPLRIALCLVQTGANNILCDFPADASRFLAECSARKVAFRRNINSTEFLTTRPEEVRKEALRAISEADGYPGFILGTGVVPYGTPLDCLLAAREAVERTTNDEP